MKQILSFLCIIFFSISSCLGQSEDKLNVGLLVVATGKYIRFVEPLINSAEKHFLTNHNVTYFIFTDGEVPQKENIVKIYQKKLGWPYDTMMRPSMYYNSKELLEAMDYLYSCDADMSFVYTVGDEILSSLVATAHPQRRNYFAGAFYGGKPEKLFEMWETIINNIESDLARNVIAKHHEETHQNNYFKSHKPTRILDSTYCWEQGKKNPRVQPKLLALNKNHKQMRS